MNSTKEFYEGWANQQMRDKSRVAVLKWKAVNFLNLLLRNKLEHFNTICEIGGAEGILLDTLDKVIDIKNIDNYDISRTFCDAGKILYPKIHFKNYEFSDNPIFYDLVLLSDITEHVENDHAFLNTICKYSNYTLIKIPIEKSIINSVFFHAIRFKKIPETLKYGEKHVNGHLRGYTIRSAHKLVSKYFSIIDHEISDVAYFNPSRKKTWLKRVAGKRTFVRIYGGAYFALGESRYVNSDIK